MTTDFAFISFPICFLAVNRYILLEIYMKITFFVIVGLLFVQYFCIKNKPDNKLYYPHSANAGLILACKA